jgi:hypothetical protein
MQMAHWADTWLKNNWFEYNSKFEFTGLQGEAIGRPGTMW